MTNDLLASVLRDPDNDDLRLVYADYIDECGDGDRSEFVRVQCEMHRLSPLKPAADAFRQNCPVLTCVGVTPGRSMTEPIDDRMYGMPIDLVYAGRTPPTFHCRVSDKEVPHLERPGRQTSMERPRGGATVPYQWLVGAVVECAMHNPDGTMRVNRDGPRYRFTVGAVDRVDRNVRDRYVEVDLRPTVMADHTPEIGYYYTHTTEIDRYNALRDRERDLFAPENVRKWVDGPWFADDFNIIGVRNCPTADVIAATPPHSLNYQRVEIARFRFARGFVEEAWFRQGEAVVFAEELRKSHPCGVTKTHIINAPDYATQSPERELEMRPAPDRVSRGDGVTSNADGTGRLARPDDVAWAEVVDEVIRTNGQGQSFVTVRPINPITAPWGSSRSTPLENLQAVRDAYNLGVSLSRNYDVRDAIVGIMPPPNDALHSLVEDDEDGDD